MDGDGTTIKDGRHELHVYKVIVTPFVINRMFDRLIVVVVL